MTFKSYYGATIREALSTARQELGQEAVVVASRQVDASESLPGAYEVVCGTLPGDKRPAAPTPQQANRPANAVPQQGRLRTAPPEMTRPAAAIPQTGKPAPLQAPPEPVLVPVAAGPRDSGLSQLKKHVKTIRTVITGNTDAEASLEQLRQSLLVDGFDDNLSAQIVSGVRRRLDSLPPDAALAAELDARTPIEAELGRRVASRKITALVGPPGVGKTTMIAKLAVRYGLTGRKPLHLISLDGSRVGGTDSLRAYAAGMGISLETVETGAALNQAIESHPSAGLILIDTSGLGPADLDGASEIAQALARNIEVDVQLVVSATSSPADLKATFTRFRMFLPSRILVTNVDAAVSCRPVIGLSLANETALSFLGTGGRVPEDLEEASVPCLLRLSGAKAGRTAVSAA